MGPQYVAERWLKDRHFHRKQRDTLLKRCCDLQIYENFHNRANHISKHKIGQYKVTYKHQTDNQSFIINSEDPGARPARQ